MDQLGPHTPIAQPDEHRLAQDYLLARAYVRSHEIARAPARVRAGQDQLEGVPARAPGNAPCARTDSRAQPNALLLREPLRAAMSRHFPAADPDDRDDAAQEAFGLYYRHAARGAFNATGHDTRAAFRWLRITASRILVRNMGYKRRVRSLEACGAEPACEDEAVHAFEFGQTLQTILNHLAPRDREILVLRHIEGASFEEIADARKQSVKTCHRQYERAMKRARAIALNGKW